MNETVPFVLGPLGTNGYVYHDGATALIIDPSHEPSDVLDYINSHSLSPRAVVLTHGHFDHFLGIDAVQAEYAELPVYIHTDDVRLLKNPRLSGAEMLPQSEPFTRKTEPLVEGHMTIAGFDFEVFHIPGHTPGGIALYDGEVLFSGDSLFAGAVGRTDFEYGDHSALINAIEKKIFSLPPETVVYPGHGMRTTVGIEKKTNPFFP
ncbi:MAG: MBL fold metallo-hydrolase [Fibrobacterota bacterium]